MSDREAFIAPPGAWFSRPVMMASAPDSRAYRQRQRIGALTCRVEISLHFREWLIETGRLAEASSDDLAKVAAAIERLLIENFRHGVTQRRAGPK